MVSNFTIEEISIVVSGYIVYHPALRLKSVSVNNNKSHLRHKYFKPVGCVE